MLLKKDASVHPKLSWAENLVKLTDNAFTIPGTGFRFGLDPILGLIPVAGETVSLLISLALVFGFVRQGANTSLLLRMLGNVLLDYLVGSIPVIGDIFDFGFKANQRNLSLAQKYLTEHPGEPAKSLLGLLIVFLVGTLLFLMAVGFASWKLIEWLFV